MATETAAIAQTLLKVTQAANVTSVNNAVIAQTLARVTQQALAFDTNQRAFWVFGK